MPLFPIGQTINYKYISNLLESYFCWQVTITITRIIPLRIIYVIILWTMVQCRHWITLHDCFRVKLPNYVIDYDMTESASNFLGVFLPRPFAAKNPFGKLR